MVETAADLGIDHSKLQAELVMILVIDWDIERVTLKETDWYFIRPTLYVLLSVIWYVCAIGTGAEELTHEVS